MSSSLAPSSASGLLSQCAASPAPAATSTEGCCSEADAMGYESKFWKSWLLVLRCPTDVKGSGGLLGSVNFLSLVTRLWSPFTKSPWWLGLMGAAWCPNHLHRIFSICFTSKSLREPDILLESKRLSRQLGKKMPHIRDLHIQPARIRGTHEPRRMKRFFFWNASD